MGGKAAKGRAEERQLGAVRRSVNIRPVALRLIFESADGEVRLIRKSRVDMVAPAPPVDIDQRGPGVYAEVRDGADRTIYRTNVSAQFHPTVEVFNPDGPVQRVDVPNQKRVVVLVVPESPDAQSLALVRHGGQEEQAVQGRLRAEFTAAEEELLRVSLSGEDMIE